LSYSVSKASVRSSTAFLKLGSVNRALQDLPEDGVPGIGSLLASSEVCRHEDEVEELSELAASVEPEEMSVGDFRLDQMVWMRRLPDGHCIVDHSGATARRKVELRLLRAQCVVSGPLVRC
jgi:hypothetical protein